MIPALVPSVGVLQLTKPLERGYAM